MRARTLRRPILLALALTALGQYPAAAEAPHTIARQASVKSGFSTRLTPAYDAAVTAYFAAMTVQPDATRKALLANLIQGLEADGIWSKLDWFVICAAHDRQAGRINARNPSQQLTEQGTLSFTTDQGFTGDGTSSYLSYGTTFTASGTMTLTSATIGTWSSNIVSSRADIGTLTNSDIYIVAAKNPLSIAARLMGSSSLAGPSGAQISERHLTTTRTGSTATLLMEGVDVLQSTIAPDAAPPTSNGGLLLGRVQFSDHTINVGYSGAYLTDTEVGKLHARLATYLNAIGLP